MKTASFHSDAVTFQAKAIMIDDVENADPSEHSFISVDVLTCVPPRPSRKGVRHAVQPSKGIPEVLLHAGRSLPG